MLHFYCGGARGGARLERVARRVWSAAQRSYKLLMPRCVFYERKTSLGDAKQDLGAVRKMTAEAKLAVRTTLREASSDGPLRFRAKLADAGSSASSIRSRAPPRVTAGICSVSSCLHLDYLVLQQRASLGHR